MDNASSETGFRLARLGEQVGHPISDIAEAHRVCTTKSCCTRWPCSAGERLMFRRNRLGFHAGMDKRVSCATWTQDKKKKNGSIPRSFFASVQLLQIVRAATRRSPCPSNSPFQLIIWARGRRGTPRSGDVNNVREPQPCEGSSAQDCSRCRKPHLVTEGGAKL